MFFLRDHFSCVFSSNIGPHKLQSSKRGSRKREFDRENIVNVQHLMSLSTDLLGILIANGLPEALNLPSKAILFEKTHAGHKLPRDGVIQLWFRPPAGPQLAARTGPGSHLCGSFVSPSNHPARVLGRVRPAAADT